jgi:type II secretory pathway component PulC
MRRASSFAIVVAASFAAACGGKSAPDAAAPATTSTPAATPVDGAVAARRTTSIRRSEVRAAVEKGLGYFLQGVTVDEWPVMRQGRFHGFRIRAIHAPWGVDLQPGDVVTRVNGMPIERPEQADAAFRTLEKAASLRVDYERDGIPRVLDLPIVDDAPAAAAKPR